MWTFRGEITQKPQSQHAVETDPDKDNWALVCANKSISSKALFPVCDSFHLLSISHSGLTEASVTSHFNGILVRRWTGEMGATAALEEWPYLSLRIFQYNLHIFTSAPGVLVLPDEVSWRTGCDSSICSPNLEERKDLSTPRAQDSRMSSSATRWDFNSSSNGLRTVCPAACGQHNSELLQASASSYDKHMDTQSPWNKAATLWPSHSTKQLTQSKFS